MTLSQRRVAVLVVHGVGSQPRYSTMDKVVQGLAAVLGATLDRISHVAGSGQLVEVTGAPLSGVMLEVNRPLPRTGARRLAVYEAYWAPLPRGFSTVRSVAIWVWRSMLTPLQRFGRINLEGVPRGRRLEIVAREFAWALVAGGTALAALLSLGWFYFDQSSSGDGQTSFIDMPGGRAILSVVLVMLMVHFVLVVVRMVGPIARHLRRSIVQLWVGHVRREPIPRSPDRVVDRLDRNETNVLWGWVSLGWAVAIGCAIRYGVGLDAVGPREWITTIALVGAIAIALLLVAYVGDIAVYVAEDTQSQAGEARARILDTVTEQLRIFLCSAEFDTVHIVAHSLGSQIAYDAMNRLRSEVEFSQRVAGPTCQRMPLTDQEYDRIGSFITIACPLDRIAYFFRSVESHRSPIRTELVRRRSGLRWRGFAPAAWYHEFDRDLRKSRRSMEAQRTPAPHYEPHEPQDFAWLNIKAWPDPIGTELVRYRPDRGVKIRFASLNAHRRVLLDRRTYESMMSFL